MPWGFAYLMTMVVLFAAVAILGACVAAYAFLAYRRGHERAMLALAVGLVFLSIGPAVSWLGLYAVSDNLYMASEGCAAFLAAGFACLFVSVRSRFA